MDALAILQELPRGFRVERGSRGVLAAHEDFASVLARAGFTPDGGGTLRPSELRGRGPLGELRAEGARLVVRRFRHGGLLRWVTGTRYADPERPFRELVVSERLRAEGVDTPRVAAARAVRARLTGWTLDLVTQRVEGVIEWAQWLELVREGRVGQRERQQGAVGVGELVGRLHRLGLVHADLTPQNILVRRGGAGRSDLRPWVCDLDRAILVAGGLDVSARRANLARLLRAVLRREEGGRPFLTRADFRRFLQGYGGILGAEEDWREDWHGVWQGHARGRSAHRLAGRVERAFGAGPEKRDARPAVRP